MNISERAREWWYSVMEYTVVRRATMLTVGIPIYLFYGLVLGFGIIVDEFKEDW